MGLSAGILRAKRNPGPVKRSSDFDAHTASTCFTATRRPELSSYFVPPRPVDTSHYYVIDTRLLRRGHTIMRLRSTSTNRPERPHG